MKFRFKLITNIDKFAETICLKIDTSESKIYKQILQKTSAIASQIIKYSAGFSNIKGSNQKL